MADSTEAKQMESWDVDEVFEFMKRHFSEYVGRKFKEQKMKGSLLRFFALNASMEQFVACGLEDIGSQMEFQRLVKEHTGHADDDGSTEILTSTSSLSSDSFKSRSCDSSVKPSRKALKNMSPLDSKIYKAKRRTVQEKAVMRWPGNDIPVFRKNVKALKELNELVEELAATCTYQPCGFTKEGIRKHILDTLNERRRRIKNGHDYTKGDARQKKHDNDNDSEKQVGKSKADDHTMSNTESESSEDECNCEQVHPSTNIDPKPKRKSKAVDHSRSKKKLLVTTESESEDDHASEQQVLSSKSVDPKPTGSKENAKSKSTKEMANAPKCKDGTATSNAVIKSAQSAQIVIVVAFNAITIRAVTRSQLVSASKTLKLQLKPSLSREEYLLPVASGLITAGYVTLKKEIGPVLKREDITVLKSF